MSVVDKNKMSDIPDGFSAALVKNIIFLRKTEENCILFVAIDTKFRFQLNFFI